MRFFVVAADVAMGVFVGIFLFAVITRVWPSIATMTVAIVVVLSSILIVLFRPPHGSLAPKRE
jgi:hypothetical protein